MKSLKAGTIFLCLFAGIVGPFILSGCGDDNPASSDGGPGDWIAYEQYSESAFDIYRMNPDGSHRINLTKGEGDNYSPAWSSTREWLAFVSDRDGQLDIYVMNSLGGSVTRMTAYPGYDGRPQWAPDDTRITFISNRNDGHMEIYVTSLEYHDAIQLTHGNSSVGNCLAWSPDGHTLAFVRTYPDYFQMGDLCLVDDDGSNQRVIADSVYYDSRIQWSSDGIRILFTRKANGYLQVYVINNDGSALTNLINQQVTSGDGQWSPDESRIAFRRFITEESEIFVMSSDGSGVTNITNAASDEERPIWSPDGNKILFESNRLGEINLYIMDDDGGNEMPLTDTVESYTECEACW